MCRHSCPTHLVTRSDACSPTGRALIIELYRGGKSAFTEAAVNRLYQCNLCSACRLWCKPQHDLPRIIELARERIVQEHRAPKGLLDLDEIVTTHGNVYGEPTSRRFTIPKSESYPLNKNAHVLYFVGCTTSYRHPEIAKATVKILTCLGIKVSLLTGEKSEVCCGSPLIRAGFTDNAKALAKQNIDAIIDADIRTVITTCPGCARALKIDYPKLGLPLPEHFKVLHITELLTKHRTQLASHIVRSPFSSKGNGIPIMTYHDPCHMGRELGIYDPPRQLISLLPKVQFVELSHSRDHADCCGGGGVLPKTFPNLATEIGKRRIEDSIQIGAQYITSCCPNCKQHFKTSQDSINDANKPVPIDLMELIAHSLK